MLSSMREPRQPETPCGVHHERRGSGAPLLLLHGIGHRWQAWTPVLERLGDFDAVAVDLPGFGLSPALPGGQPRAVADLTDRIEDLLDELGWPQAHILGNSLGGWIAFELAQRGRALSVTALAPGGLTVGGFGRRRWWFLAWVHGARLMGPNAPLLRTRLGRTLALSLLFGKPWRIPAQIAVEDARALAGSPTLPMLASILDAHFTGGRDIAVPVTVAWASRDPLFRPTNCTVSELPAQTRVVMLPGCGHVPMWDDPELVVAVLRETVAAAGG
jgi:pimeloyl-ACP methyl ester carboxylesterase